MKKLMIAAAIVCAAVAVNASTVTWGINSGALDTKKFADGSKLYLIAGTTPVDLKDFSVSKFTINNILAYAEDSLALLHDGDNEITLASGKGQYKGGSNGVKSFGGTLDGEVWKDTKTGRMDVYAIAVSADGKYAAVSTAKYANILDANTPAQMNWAGGNFTVYAAAVPEPTSGLLLLLGVAGLALKRKRA